MARQKVKQWFLDHWVDMMLQTIPEHFLSHCADTPNNPAVHIKTNGQYRALTWGEVQHDVRRYAANLRRLGVQQGDRVVQFSENRYEWILVDLALHLIGAIHVPVHSTLSGSQVVEQVVDSTAHLMLVSTPSLMAKLRDANEPLPSQVVLESYEPIAGSESVGLFDHRDLDLAEAVQLEKTVGERLSADSYATILYTSGTTGEPKGVVLNQRNLVSNSVAIHNVVEPQPDDVRLNFLPLSHIFARTGDLYGWLIAGSHLALAESRDTVVQDAQMIRPTIVNAVPYFWGRIQKVLAELGKDTEKNAVRNLLGGRIRFCCSGGAPLTTPLYDYFKSQQVPLLQGYGLTESSPVITVCAPHADRRGSVGRPIEDVEINVADDGEVLTRGPHVMVGYWNNEAATNEAIRDGWLYTGDLGRIDEDGYLYITGRKKELIVTATGKNVAPAYLEALLVEDPLIAQAVVIGDNRKFLTALIVPDPEALKKAMSVKYLPDLNGEDVQGILAEHIASRLTEVAKNEQIGKITVLSRPFSVDEGELTAKLSLRRAVIEEHFADEIEAMYQ